MYIFAERELRAADFDFEGHIWPRGHSLPTPEVFQKIIFWLLSSTPHIPFNILFSTKIGSLCSKDNTHFFLKTKVLKIN